MYLSFFKRNLGAQFFQAILILHDLSIFGAITELKMQTVALVAVQFNFKDVQKMLSYDFQSDPLRQSQKPHLDITQPTTYIFCDFLLNTYYCMLKKKHYKKNYNNDKI